jgi:E3 ubiquitin-protein ligase mind-bomb
MIKELVNHKDVNVNLKNNQNQTELHVASVWKNMSVDLFRKILEKSSDVNAQEKDGHTALHGAIRRKSETGVGELLKCNDINLNIKSCVSKTALHLASLWKNIPIELFRVIIEKSTNVNAQDDGTTALHWATFKQSTTAVEELLKHKDVDVNLKDNDNQMALHYAAVWKKISTELLTKILEKSADVNAQDERGNTALHRAIIQENKTAVKVLLKRKEIDFNLKNNQNQTALHLTSVKKDIPIDLFRMILEISTDVNAQDERGCTALHFAIIFKNRTAVEELLKRMDVNVTLKNNKNQTALNLCSEWKGIPANLLKIINEKTTAENNAEAKNEAT